MKPYSAPTIKGALVGKDLVQDRVCWHYYRMGGLSWSRAQAKASKHGARQYAKKSILQDMLAEALEDQRLAEQQAYEDSLQERGYDAYADDYCDDRFLNLHVDWYRDNYESFSGRFDPDYGRFDEHFWGTSRWSSHDPYWDDAHVESDGYGEDNRLYWDASDEGWKERTEARAWVHLEMEAKDEAWARHLADLDAACDDEPDIDDVLFVFEQPMHFNDWIGRKPR